MDMDAPFYLAPKEKGTVTMSNSGGTMPAPEEVRREMNANFTVFALAGLGILILTLAADWWVALGVFFLIRANNIDRDSRRKQNPIAKLALSNGGKG